MNILKKFFTKFKKESIKIDDDFLEDLEETLIQADIGVKTTQEILEHIELINKDKKLENSDDLILELKKYLKDLLLTDEIKESNELNIIMFAGINGVGKTTSLAKVAYHLKNKGKKVKLVAGDTFRAAAIDQIAIWADRLDLPIVKTTHGADSAAVVFDGITSALSDNTDYLLIDTAGRMHTSDDLMRELQKIRNICLKRIPEERIENIIVVDSTTGQNSYIQTETFNNYIPINGVFLSKYDSIFKGGMVIRISNELKIPIKFTGTGETFKDLNIFKPDEFIETLGIE